jgi:hypothetical protein
VAHFDGSAWSFVRVSTGTRATAPVTAMVGIDSTHVYFASEGALGALDGDRFGLFDAGTWRDLAAIDATGPRDLWTAGQGGTVMHFDGARWSREPTNTAVSLTGIEVLAPDDVWAWGGETLLHRDANGWAPRADGLTGSYGRMVSAVMGRSPDRVYAVGTFGIARLDGTRWEIEVPVAALGEPAGTIAAACATAQQLVIVTSNGSVVTHALD